jgi:uncharacterized protein with HEPN domain
MQRDALLISEMIEAARAACSFVGGLDASEVAADRQRRDALLWNFTVLGEAAAQVSETTKSRFPEIPWSKPARLRNRIVHGYWSIDIDILHATATHDLPTLVEQLRAALTAVESQSPPEID